jgi:DNA-binding LytR/AlgR family response regulator
MEKIPCIVLDDDVINCELVASYIEETPRLELAAKFTKPAQASAYLMRNPVPLIFIDMKMPDITGIDFLRTLAYKPYAIILSSYPDFALEGYEVNALDYILKPFEEARFFAAVNKAVKIIDVNEKANATDTLKNIIKTGEGFFFIHTRQQYVKIQYKDVLYIEALENFVKIYTRDKEEPIIGLVNLKLIESSLPAEIFLRTHKSYIINMNHVNAMDQDNMKLENKLVPIGRAYKDVVMETVIRKNLIKH